LDGEEVAIPSTVLIDCEDEVLVRCEFDEVFRFGMAWGDWFLYQN